MSSSSDAPARKNGGLPPGTVQFIDQARIAVRAGRGGDGISAGKCDCDGNVQDCAGVCGGDAQVDACGICTGGDTGLSQCVLGSGSDGDDDGGGGGGAGVFFGGASQPG